ncbi:MAG: hypothetical protein CL521_05565, partial [Actinobacteria bacterium]|nr:hypothetical protein [Actinomycetota bacterium]
MKVLQLAKELNIPIQELMGIFRENRMRIKSSNVKLDPAKVDMVKRIVRSRQLSAQKQEQVFEAKDIQLDDRVYRVNELVSVLDLALPELMKFFLK